MPSSTNCLKENINVRNCGTGTFLLLGTVCVVLGILDTAGHISRGEQVDFSGVGGIGLGLAISLWALGFYCTMKPDHTSEEVQPLELQKQTTVNDLEKGF